MRLTVIGATGRVGRLVVARGLAAGHAVRAVGRDTSTVDERAVPVRTSLDDVSDALREAVDGAEAVVSCIGPRSSQDAGIAERGTGHVIEAMRATGADRLVAVSAVPVGRLRPSPEAIRAGRDPGDDLLTAHVLLPVLGRVLRRRYADLARMEDLVAASGLRWLVVRPPRLTDAPATGRYRSDLRANVPSGHSIARADLADCLVDAVEDGGVLERLVTGGAVLRVAA